MASPRKDSTKTGSLPALPKSGRHAVPAARAGGASGRAASNASREPAAPEIGVGYTPAENETMAAIAEELGQNVNEDGPDKRAPGSAPRQVQQENHHEIIVEEDELTLPRMPRTRVNTTNYGDRVANAPGAVTPPASGQPSRGPEAKSRAPAAQKSRPAATAKPPIPPRPAPSRPPPEPVARPWGRAKVEERSQAQAQRGPETDLEPVKREPFQLSSPDLLKAAQISISEIRGEDAVIDVGDGEPDTGVRTRQQTMDFAERPRNRDTAPEVITIEERPIGRETLAAIAEELARENAAFLRDLPQEDDAPLEIMEMATFVVRGRDVMRLSSEAARREFVAERLMHRLPVASIDEVDRIDVTPWTVRGTVVLRVWCKVV